MKILKQVISLILFFGFGISAVLNILFLFGKINIELIYTGFFILVLVVSVISALGIVLKNVRRDETVQINIMTPVKELKFLYTGMLVIWAVTYFLAMIFK